MTRARPPAPTTSVPGAATSFRSAPTSSRWRVPTGRGASEPKAFDRAFAADGRRRPRRGPRSTSSGRRSSRSPAATTRPTSRCSTRCSPRHAATGSSSTRRCSSGARSVTPTGTSRGGTAGTRIATRRWSGSRRPMPPTSPGDGGAIPRSLPGTLPTSRRSGSSGTRRTTTRAAWTRALVEAIRTADPGALVTIGTAGQEVGWGPFRADVVAGDLDVATVHPYPIYEPDLYPDGLLGSRMTHAAAFETAFAAGAGRPVMVHEYGASSTQFDPERIAAYDRLLCWSSLGRGSDRLLRLVLDRRRACGVRPRPVRAPAARDPVRGDRLDRRPPPARPGPRRSRGDRPPARPRRPRGRRSGRRRRDPRAARVRPTVRPGRLRPRRRSGRAVPPGGDGLAAGPRRDATRRRPPQRLRPRGPGGHLHGVPAGAPRRSLAGRAARPSPGAARLHLEHAAPPGHDGVGRSRGASRARRDRLRLVLGRRGHPRDGRHPRRPDPRPRPGRRAGRPPVRALLGPVRRRRRACPAVLRRDARDPQRHPGGGGRKRRDRGRRDRRARPHRGPPRGGPRGDAGPPARAPARRDAGRARAGGPDVGDLCAASPPWPASPTRRPSPTRT